MLTGLRTVLVSELAAGYALTGSGYVPGVTVHADWPAGPVNPPACILTPPVAGWVLAGQGYGYEVRLDLTLVVARSLAQLESLTETALRYSADWALLGVDGPGDISIGGTVLLGARIHIAQQAKLE